MSGFYDNFLRHRADSVLGVVQTNGLSILGLMVQLFSFSNPLMKSLLWLECTRTPMNEDNALYRIILIAVLVVASTNENNEADEV